MGQRITPNSAAGLKHAALRSALFDSGPQTCAGAWAGVDCAVNVHTDWQLRWGMHFYGALFELLEGPQKPFDAVPVCGGSRGKIAARRALRLYPLLPEVA